MVHTPDTNGSPGRFSVLGDSEASGEIDLLPADYEAFRIDPQARPMYALLDLCLRDGNHHALAYNHLYDVTYNPSQGLKLTFSDHIVTIAGRRLGELFRYLKRQRVVWIWEALPQQERLADADSSVVTQIKISPRTPNALTL